MELARGTRWLSLSLPFALAGAAMLARPAPPGLAAAAGPMPGRACAAWEATADAGAGGAPAWYRLDPQLDMGGTLVGRRLTVGRGTARWTATLPPESFASGPVLGRVLVGDDDGRRSRLRVLDTERGCWSVLGTEADVIRSGVLAPDGTASYEHRVGRLSRQDLGVWRRDPRDPAASEPVIGAADADAADGPTFATSLMVTEDGRLAVNSCGEHACRTRVVDLTSGARAAVAGTGPLVGLAGGRLVALDKCVGMPCSLVAVDLETGARATVAESIGSGALAGRSGVVIAARSGGLTVSDPSGGDPAPVAGSAGLAPIPRTSTAESGFESPSALIAVAPDGHVTDPALVRLLDPASLQLSAGEVLP